MGMADLNVRRCLAWSRPSQRETSRVGPRAKFARRTTRDNLDRATWAHRLFVVSTALLDDDAWDRDQTACTVSHHQHAQIGMANAAPVVANGFVSRRGALGLLSTDGMVLGVRRLTDTYMEGVHLVERQLGGVTGAVTGAVSGVTGSLPCVQLVRELCPSSLAPC